MAAEPDRGQDPGVHFRILTGARASAIVSAAGPRITIGRHPESDLRFHPDDDRSVSNQHAVVFRKGGRWLIRDLGSRNGTLVNQRLISGDAILDHGARIAFGAGGPEAEFRLGAASAAPPTSNFAREPDTGERVRVLVRGKTRQMTIAMGLMGGILIAAVILVLTASERRELEWALERDAMMLRIDSMEWSGGQALAELESQLAGLNAALEHSEEQVGALQRSLGAAIGRGAETEASDLRRQLDSATVDLRGMQTTAAVDFQAIRSQNRPSIAMIYVEMPNGEVSTGSAFAVLPNATLVTSKHLVAGAQGRSRPRRIAVQFSDSDQAWPARVLALASDADLAIVKIDNIAGDVPVIRGFNLRPDTLSPGSPVVVIGFALGGEPMSAEAGRGGIARPTLSAGAIQAIGPDRIEVFGYGDVGASGSPILDSLGEVVGVVFGGRSSGANHTLLAVPAPAAAKLLEAVR